MTRCLLAPLPIPAATAYLYTFIIRNHFLRNLHEEAKILKELVPLTTKYLKDFSTSNIFAYASNRNLGSQFHPLLSNSHELRVIHVASASREGFPFKLTLSIVLCLNIVSE